MKAWSLNSIGSVCQADAASIFFNNMGTHVKPLVARIPAIELPPQLQQIVDKTIKELDWIVADPHDIPKELAETVHGLVHYSPEHCHIGANLMDLFPNLKIISNFGVGVDHIDVTAATERGIVVGNTPDVLSDCTADMAFALLLASARNVVEGDRITRSPETKQFAHLHGYYGSEVSGSTIGIVGMGKIGCAVAKRAHGFGMRVLYHNRNRREDEKQLGAEYCSTLAELLPLSDFVVLCMPLKSDTKHLIAAKQLSLMKPTATLVNIARGGVVNHADLTTALQTGVIRAAAVDVTEPEPLPRDHPLLKLSNVTFTPHFGSATANTRIKMMELVLMNLKAGLKGEKLSFGVNC